MIVNLINGQYIDMPASIDATLNHFIDDKDRDATLQINSNDIILQLLRPGLKSYFLNGGRSLLLYKSDIKNIKIQLDYQ